MFELRVVKKFITHFVFNNFFLIKHAICVVMWERHNALLHFTATVVKCTCNFVCSFPVLLNITICYRPPFSRISKARQFMQISLLLWSLTQQYEIRYIKCVFVCVYIEDKQDVLPKIILESISQTFVSFHSIKSCICQGLWLTAITGHLNSCICKSKYLFSYFNVK